MRISIRVAIVGLLLIPPSISGCSGGSRRVGPVRAPMAAARIARSDVADRVRARLTRAWDRETIVERDQ